MTTTTRGARYGVLPWVVVVAAIALSSASNPRGTDVAAAGSTGTASSGSTVSGSTGGSSTCGTCNGNNGNGAGNGGSAGSGSPGHTLTLSGVVAGYLAPGRVGTLTVTIANPNNQDITVRSVSGRVSSVGTRGLVGKLPCDANWFEVTPFSSTKVIGKNASGSVVLPFALKNLPTTNQDNCKGVSLAVTFSATADAA